MRTLWVGLAAGGVIALGACGSSNNGDLFKGGVTGGSGGSSASGGSNVGGVAGQNAGGTGNVAASGGSNTGGTGNTAASGGSNTGGTGNAAATGGTAGTGGSVSDGGPPPITLDNVCGQLAPKLCALKQSCCQKTVGYDQANCESNELNDCQTKVDEVKSGQRTFHPGLIADCLSAATPLYNACYFSGDQLPGYRLTSNVCDAIFDLVGAGPGTSCNAAADCTSSTQQNGYAFCYQGQCTAGQVLGPGADCSTGYLCGPGLYCKTTGTNSACSQTVALGGNCTQSVQCGLGFYCANGKCAPAQTEGSYCTLYLHCLSLSCSQNQCDAQAPYVDGQACGV